MHRNLTDYPRPPKPKSKKKLYPDSKKLEAVKLWMLTGNMSATAAALSIPYITLQSWRYSEWWKNLVEELKTQETLELNYRLKKIAEKSLDAMVDRLENGDYYFDKDTGQLKRKPVNLRDTTLAYNSLHDRRMKMMDVQSHKQEEKQVMDRLSALAQKFEEIANKRQPIQVTDVVFVENTDAVHEGETESPREGGVQSVVEGRAASLPSGKEQKLLPEERPST